MEQEETITIPKAEYDRLLENDAWLDALNLAGVDNWDGYDYAREIYRENN